MTRAMRLLVALLLVLAVPLQGLAGMTMAACGPGHMGASHAEHVVPHGADHDGAHHHGADHHGADHHAASHAGEHPVPESGSPHEAHDCAGCAACCSLSAVPVPALLAQGATPAPSVAIPFLEAVRESFAPEGLERPPSTVLVG